MSNRVHHPRARCCWCQGRFFRGTFKGTKTWFCETEACQKRQLARALVVVTGGRARCLYVPTPAQVRFEEASEEATTVYIDGTPVQVAKTVLYGGAAGGAKSHALRWLFIRLCLQYPGLNCLLLRRNLTELDETHIKRVLIEQDSFGGRLHQGKNVLRFPNNSTIKFGHLDDPKDVTNFLSTEYEKIGFDELVTFPQDESLLIMSRARSTRTDILPGVVAGTNPGGPEAYWVRRYWLDKNITSLEDPIYAPDDYTYLPARLEDNPHLGAAYEASLMRLPEELRRAYRDGDWDIFPGQFFQEWRRNKHVFEGDIHSLPSGRMFLSVDWGYMAPGVALFYLMTDEGRTYVLREYVFRYTVASEVAKEIKRIASELGWRNPHGVGDTDMGKPGTDTGESPMETFTRFGINLTPADKNRKHGWQRLRHWLRDAPDGKPWLQIHESCAYLTRTIPALIMHDKFHEDIADGLEDHAADSLRYWAMSRPSPGVDMAMSEPPAGSPAWLLRQSRGSQQRTFGKVS